MQTIRLYVYKRLFDQAKTSLIFLFFCLLCLAKPLHAEKAKDKKELYKGLQDLGYKLHELPSCRIQEQNTCQEKSSGGHQGTIFSTEDGFCVKEIRSIYNVKEIAFYKKMAKKCAAGTSKKRSRLCSFIPRFDGLCLAQEKVYCKLQNLKKLAPTSSPSQDLWVLDIKVGQHTASTASMQKSGAPFYAMAFWNTIHFFQDKVLTSSNKQGYRYAGASGGVIPKHYFQKLRYYAKPQKVIQKFLAGGEQAQLKACFARKLENLESFVMSSSFQGYHLIGASLLFLYERHQPPHALASPPECGLYLIDFANSFILSKDDPLLHSQGKHLKYVEGFRKGIRKLTQVFKAS